MANNYVMTAKDLVEKARSIANLKTVYAYGGLGYHGTAEQKARVIKAHPVENNKAKIKNADEDTWLFDCIGFVKAILNGFNASKKNPSTGRDYNYGGATFPVSGPLSAKGGASDFFNEYCVHISNDFSKIVPGSAVWLKATNGGDSHIGIYLGDGLAAECTPKWKDGVQITSVLNIASVSGYNGRTWTYWGTIPCVDYSVVSAPKTETTPATTKGVTTYTVKSGDTLSKIASKYGVSVNDLVAWNGIKNPNIISKGQKLIVGKATTYTVKSGDTLSAIAKKYGTTTLKLQLANGILNPNKISVGQVLVIK